MLNAILYFIPIQSDSVTIYGNLIRGKEILEQTFNSIDRKESCILIELPHLP